MKENKLEQIKLKYIKNNLEVYKQNKELILMYDKYIENIVELFDFIMEKDSDLFYTIVFAILLEIGFFSADRNFNSDIENYHELLIKPGISIISGAGVCRNTSCFYEDVFSYFYNYPLKMCCLDKNNHIDEDNKRYGNHMINLTSYEETIFGFDIMNHCIFKAIDFDKLQGIDINYYLDYVPNGDLLVELTTSLKPRTHFYEDVYRKYYLFEIAATKNVLSMDKYQELIMKANNFIIARKKILQSFLQENEELTYEIKKKMLSL